MEWEEHGLAPDEIVEIEDAVKKMTEAQLCETLDTLARREVSLVSDPRVQGDEEMREITRWNIAALVAASERLTSG